MIKELTPEQRAKMPYYRDKWTKIGLATQDEPMDQEKVKDVLTRVYKNGGHPPPQEFVFTRSPFETAQLASKRLGEKKPYANESIYGQHDANWLGFYEFFRVECGLVKETEKIVPLMELAHLTGWVLPFDEVCYVSNKPIKCVTRNGRTHCEDGPAIEYGDGFCVYVLNGVRMRGVVHLMRPDADPQEILNVKNVEQRAELIKLYGIERLFDKLNPTLLDSDADGYELYRIEILSGSPRIYLKMTNPSVDEIHLEAVHPECTTVAIAKHWRNFGDTKLPVTGFEQPVVLT